MLDLLPVSGQVVGHVALSVAIIGHVERVRLAQPIELRVCKWAEIFAGCAHFVVRATPVVVLHMYADVDGFARVNRQLDCVVVLVVAGAARGVVDRGTQQQAIQTFRGVVVYTSILPPRLLDACRAGGAIPPHAAGRTACAVRAPSAEIAIREVARGSRPSGRISGERAVYLRNGVCRVRPARPDRAIIDEGEVGGVKGDVDAVGGGGSRGLRSE